MVNCPRCGNENSNKNKFCGNCGSKLPEPKICPECGYTSFEEKFCVECGEQLLSKNICKKIKSRMKEARNLISVQYKIDEGIEIYDDVLNRVPDYLEAWDNKANTLKDLKRYDDAMQCINQALDINPYNISLISTKAYILSAMKRYDESIEYIDGFLDEYPFDDLLFEVKGNLFGNMKNYEEAVKCYDKSLEINPKNRICVSLKLRALIKLKRYDEALKCCEFFKDDEFSYYRNIIKIYRQMGEYDKALDCCEKLYKSNSNRYYVLLEKGNIYFDMKKYIAALRCYNDVLDYIPNNLNALIGKSEVLIKKENFDMARDVLSKCEPYDYLDWNKLALIYEKLNDFNKALECCDESLRINENYKALFLKAEIYFKLEDYDEALKWANKALENNSSDELTELMNKIKKTQNSN